MCKQPHILYCILDWGLGHASRSMPIVMYLQQVGYKVTIATSKKLFDEYIALELEQVAFLELKAYKPKYSKFNMQTFRLLTQIPQFLSVYFSDKSRVAAFVNAYKPDVIFSDNRFSCWHKSVKSIYITHQLSIINVKTDSVWGLPTRIHRYIINKFDLCLVPDEESGAAGLLSVDSSKKLTIKRIGLLSRLQHIKNRKHNYILVILSGPEPQRTIFETKVIEASFEISDEIVLVRGTSLPLKQKLPSSIKAYNIIGTEILSRLCEMAYYVVARSGYSTVMDLLVAHLPALLVATPGQSEQEYLSTYLCKKGWFVSKDQDDFSFLTPNELLSLKNPPLVSATNYKMILDQVLAAKNTF